MKVLHKVHKMKALLRMAALSSFIFTLSTCDKENDYRYPSVVTEFVCFDTDEEGKLAAMRLDKGGCYDLHFTDDLLEANDNKTPTYKRDTTYRAIGVYELVPTEEGDTVAHLYSFGSILSSIPTPLMEGETLHRDPVYLQSIWQSGEYLNMVIEVKALNGQHAIDFVDTTPENMQGKEFTFYHRVIKDVESYRQRLYGSIPLAPFGDALQQGDTLRFVVNTYDKGLAIYDFVQD